MYTQVKVQPEIEPIELDETKEHLQIILEDVDDDDKIGRMIKAATAAALTYTRRSFISQTLEHFLDDWPAGNVIRLPKPPLITVASIEYVANFSDSPQYKTLDAANYQILNDPSRPEIHLTPTGEFPTIDGDHAEPIRITYTAGYGTDAAAVPEGIRHAIMVLVGDFYQSRESDALGFSTANIGTVKMSRLLWSHRVPQ